MIKFEEILKRKSTNKKLQDDFLLMQEQLQGVKNNLSEILKYPDQAEARLENILNQIEKFDGLYNAFKHWIFFHLRDRIDDFDIDQSTRIKINTEFIPEDWKLMVFDTSRGGTEIYYSGALTDFVSLKNEISKFQGIEIPEKTVVINLEQLRGNPDIFKGIEGKQ